MVVGVVRLAHLGIAAEEGLYFQMRNKPTAIVHDSDNPSRPKMRLIK